MNYDFELDNVRPCCAGEYLELREAGWPRPLAKRAVGADNLPLRLLLEDGEVIDIGPCDDVTAESLGWVDIDTGGTGPISLRVSAVKAVSVEPRANHGPRD